MRRAMAIAAFLISGSVYRDGDGKVWATGALTN